MSRLLLACGVLPAAAFAGVGPQPVLFFANYSDNTVRLLLADGSTQVVLNQSNGLSGPFGSNALAIDPDGRLYVANYNAHQVLRFPTTQPTNGAGEVIADESDGVDTPDALAFHGDTLYIANREAGNVLKRAADGQVTVFDTTISSPMSIAAGASDLFVVTDFGEVLRYPNYLAGARTFLGSMSGGNVALALGAAGDVLYAADNGNIYVIDIQEPGISFLLGGLAGADEGLVLEQSDGVDVALYAADFAGRIYRIDLPSGPATQLASRPAGLSGPSGLLLVNNGQSPCLGFMRCDANCDGHVDNFDIDAFVLAITDAELYRQAYPDCSRTCGSDINGDTSVNNFDIEPFVACITG